MDEDSIMLEISCSDTELLEQDDESSRAQRPVPTGSRWCDEVDEEDDEPQREQLGAVDMEHEPATVVQDVVPRSYAAVLRTTNTAADVPDAGDVNVAAMVTSTSAAESPAPPRQTRSRRRRRRGGRRVDVPAHQLGIDSPSRPKRASPTPPLQASPPSPPPPPPLPPALATTHTIVDTPLLDVPPRFHTMLSDDTPLAELQAKEVVVSPLMAIHRVPRLAPAGDTLAVTMLLLTHSELQLTYSYRNVQLTEPSIVGVSLFTGLLTDPPDDRPRRAGLILRKSRDAYVPYTQYQRKFNSLLLRDKFFNERNFSALRGARLHTDPLAALRSVDLAGGEAAADPFVYSVYAMPEAQHMLSTAFPLMLQYVRQNGVSCVGHRLSPKLSWIASAFVHYCAERGVAVSCVKIDLTTHDVRISPDCVARENHNSVTCEVCLFDSYLAALQNSHIARAVAVPGDDL